MSLFRRSIPTEEERLANFKAGLEQAMREAERLPPHNPLAGVEFLLVILILIMLFGIRL